MQAVSAGFADDAATSLTSELKDGRHEVAGEGGCVGAREAPLTRGRWGRFGAGPVSVMSTGVRTVLLRFCYYAEIIVGPEHGREPENGLIHHGIFDQDSAPPL